MEPGQLSITLYSVCKIQNLKHRLPLCGCWSFFFCFFFSNFFFCSVSPDHVCLLLFFPFIIQVLEACDGGGWFSTTDRNTTHEDEIRKQKTLLGVGSY